MNRKAGMTGAIDKIHRGVYTGDDSSLLKNSLMIQPALPFGRRIYPGLFSIQVCQVQPLSPRPLAFLFNRDDLYCDWVDDDDT